jgi:hypothetical protein
MLDWLTWPADLLLDAAAVVVSWFVSKDSTNFGVIQMMVAVLLLAAVVSLIVYWQRLVQWLIEYWRLRWKNPTKKHPS